MTIKKLKILEVVGAVMAAVGGGLIVGACGIREHDEGYAAGWNDHKDAVKLAKSWGIDDIDEKTESET